MNEELQSTNDELQTINEELRDRTDELDDVNAFLESILGSLRAGGGRRRPRAARPGLEPPGRGPVGPAARTRRSGEHLLNLDIGLPVDRLKPGIRGLMAGEADGYDQLLLDAVNRRGRPVRVQVTTTPMRGADDRPAGVIIVMDEQDGQELLDGAAPGRETSVTS